jgi:hypothetical protein
MTGRGLVAQLEGADRAGHAGVPGLHLVRAGRADDATVTQPGRLMLRFQLSDS